MQYPLRLFPFSVSRTTIAALFLASLVGCTSSSKFSIVSRPEVTPMGTDAVESSYNVAVAPIAEKFSRELSELPSLEVFVENEGSEPIFVSPSNISVRSGGEVVDIYTPASMGERIRIEAQRKAEEYSGQQAEIFLQSGATQNDPSAALANISAAKSANRAAANRDIVSDQFEELSKMLVLERVPAGGSGSGIIRLYAEQIQMDQPLEVDVKIDDETYSFVFDIE